jgi:hypothetical protein
MSAPSAEHIQISGGSGREAKFSADFPDRLVVAAVVERCTTGICGGLALAAEGILQETADA